jgi:hypothetical protein
MNAQESYESNMRVIGYLYNTLKDNYGTMQVEDYNELSGQISRLFQQSRDLLPSANAEPEPEPIQHRRYTLLDRVRTERETQNAFQTPPPAQQSLEPLPIERNPSQSNVTMTRGENVVDLSLSDDMPMTLADLEGDDDNSSDFNSSDFMIENEEYQDYIDYKTKPKLTTKCFSMKEGREKECECVICGDEHNLHQTLTLGCGHEFCKECVCDHFHHSVENQPYKRFYACPICRADVKQVRVNYSKMNARDKRELMAGPLVTQMKTWCK